jgi:diaminohydroxyphosphoribosylaminopyrimidine deaminase / 5-amino-6-(5-phosphoribosylamino)uracil reductase
VLFGPRGRAAAVDWAGPDAVVEAPRLIDPKWELCDGDAYVRGRIQYGTGLNDV